MSEMLLAEIDASLSPVEDVWARDQWRLGRQGGIWRVHARGWDGLTRHDRLARVRFLLGHVESWAGARRLTWTASGLTLDIEAVADSHRRWADTAEVPILQMIALDLGLCDSQGRCGISSRGLAIFAGVEIEALASTDNIREQSILVARMIAHVLHHGAPDRGEAIDPSGAVRYFTRHQNGYFNSNPVICLDLQ